MLALSSFVSDSWTERLWKRSGSKSSPYSYLPLFDRGLRDCTSDTDSRMNGLGPLVLGNLWWHLLLCLLSGSLTSKIQNSFLLYYNLVWDRKSWWQKWDSNRPQCTNYLASPSSGTYLKFSGQNFSKKVYFSAKTSVSPQPLSKEKIKL